MTGYFSLAGRLLLASLFLVSAFNKLMHPVETAQYMQSMGVAGALLWPTVALELLGGLALAVGWFSRPAALMLALFSLIAAAIFHSNFADLNQVNNFLKNLAVAGGLLYLVAWGPGRFSISARIPTFKVRTQEPLATS